MQNNTFSRLYLRQNLIVLEEVSSTNDYLKELLSNIKPLREATAIMAKHQTQGKGQRGSSWETKPGENLTFSFNLYPKNLSIAQSFNLNILVCLGIHRWVSSFSPAVSIKWPNDIYINNRKIGGILIENQIQGQQIRVATIGIGLNINQRNFDEHLLNKATSLVKESQISSDFDIEECGIDLLHTILSYYCTLDLQDSEKLLTSYNQLLFRRDTPALFLIDGQQREATIREVNSEGKLILSVGQQLRIFDLKEITFII
ncbi:biotin--[acetyl-CoA-carboxylase] ligase [Sphingobacterium sp. LRF_L2]|uniref:biotin--[acetyl-CoA-carboxylase] ligase n=1 Tax=Sphingobacterium sp. LRF_L2 TaxID=3369421 RepID=UPI003F5D7CD2